MAPDETPPAGKVAPLRVFISYGHEEHEDLASKINEDLKARGHETWFDKDRLVQGQDWADCIEKGLEWVAGRKEAGCVLFLKTPHSARRRVLAIVR